MSWIVYALICAFSLATTDALSKKALRHQSVALISWVRIGYSVPFLLLILPFITIPRLEATFWKATSLALPCDIIALFIYMRAIQISPLSLTLPFLALTPIFLLGTSWLILGEVPDRSGVAGIILIVIGAYTLNIRHWRDDLLKPLKAIAQEKGSWMMVLVAFIYSLSSNFGKLAVTHSSPIFFGCIYNVLMSIIMLPVLWFNPQDKWRGVFKQPKNFLLIGFFMALMEITHFTAVGKTLVSYMISVKRTSMLFGVIYGRVLFHETNLQERLLGSVLMIGGIVLIVL